MPNTVDNKTDCIMHPKGQWVNYQYNFDNLLEVRHPSGQNRRKGSLWECIFDNMALYLSAELTESHSFRLFL